MGLDKMGGGAKITVLAKIRICKSSRAYEKSKSRPQTVSALSESDGPHGLPTGALEGPNPFYSGFFLFFLPKL